MQRASEREQVLLEQNTALLDEEKERQMELEQLREEVKRLQLQSLDESKYMDWTAEEISEWILNLDIDRMSKYEDVIRKNLKEDEADGSLLSEVDGGDLGLWGIGKLAGCRMRNNNDSHHSMHNGIPINIHDSSWIDVNRYCFNLTHFQIGNSFRRQSPSW